jgi:leader peptidase (prepilin peptidase)/N-methyltransferase
MAWALDGAWRWSLPGLLVLTLGLVALSVIDITTRRLPRRVIALVAVGSLPWLVVAALLSGAPERVLWMAVGAAVLTVVVWSARIISGGGFGQGDVLFAPLLGAALGWVDPLAIGVGLVLGLGLAAAAGLIAMAAGRATRHDSIPLGPFMAAGTLMVIAVNLGSG